MSDAANTVGSTHIRNFSDLATSRKRLHCLQILEAGLAAADPAVIVPKFVTRSHVRAGSKVLDMSKYSAIHTIAFGKAAGSMTGAVNSILPVQSGIIVVPKGSKSQTTGRKFRIFNSGHPRPDRASVKAAKEIVKFLGNRRHDELVLFLVSGGASALLALPDRITLDEKTYATDLLLKSGASIQEFNCVRKHLSRIKGGRLVSNLQCHAVGLVMSDVESNDLSAIASGTTHMDDTTFADAMHVIERYKLEKRMPQAVMQVLRDGTAGRISETPKAGIISNHIIADNGICLAAMREKALHLGYHADAMQVFGDIKVAVKKITDRIPKNEMECILFGGETTVRVLGSGAGGRNHELVLRLLKNTRRSDRMVIASIGTDGIDGNTEFAGAITENSAANPQEIREFLRNSDSGRFFQRRGSNIMTGFTHTNLMDIGMILR